MKPNVMLAITSLLSILLASFHLADDVVLGIEPGGVSNYNGVLALGATAIVSVILSARALWNLRRGQSKAAARA